MKKLKFAALPLALLLTLGACSNEENAEPTEEETAPAETDTAEQDAETTNMELPAEEDTVVVVNGEEVKGSVYNSVARQLEGSIAAQGQDASEEEIAEQVKSQAVSVIVGNKLIIQDAKEKGHEADEETVEQRVEEMKGQFENEEAMNEALEASGYTMEDFKQQLREQSIYESYLAEELTVAEVTDEEVQQAYDGYANSSGEEASALEEVEPMIRQTLKEQKTQEAVSQRIEELKADADVEVKI